MSDGGDDARLIAMVREALVNLGAGGAQAGVMAAQLLKRARQIAAERGIDEADAMRELFAKVIAGRKGEYGASPGVGNPPR